MFDIASTPIKYVALLALFVWCTVWGVVELRRSQSPRQIVSGALHLAMAVVMVMMVPKGTWHALTAVAPVWALALGSAVATAWFVWLAVDGTRRVGVRRSLDAVGHAAMFAAMTWHLSAMAVMAHQMAAAAAQHDPGMGGMGHAGMGGSSHGPLFMFAVIGLPLMAWLLGAAVNDVRRSLAPRAAVLHDCACGDNCTCGPDCSCEPAVAAPVSPERSLALVGAGAGQPAARSASAVVTSNCHAPHPVGSPGYRLSALADFAMNFGMFWMSTGLLVPVLPFFAHLSF